MNKDLGIWSLKNQDLVDLLMSREGGRTTIRIIDTILVGPYNANQLSKILHLNYKTITYHTRLIEEHDLIMRKQCKKVYYYHPTDKLIKGLDEYYYIKEHMKKNGIL